MISSNEWREKVSNIAIINQRALGHIIPSLGIAKELKRRGHNVSFLTDKNSRSLVDSHKIDVIEIGWGKYPNQFIYEQTCELLKIIKSKPYDLIICDSSLPAPSFVAEIARIPWVSLQTTIPLPDKFLENEYKYFKRIRENYRNELDSLRKKFNLQKISEARVRGDFSGLSPYLHIVTVTPELKNLNATFPKHFKFVGPCNIGRKKDYNIIKNNSVKHIMVCTSSNQDPIVKQICREYLLKTIQYFGDTESKLIICSDLNINDYSLPNNVELINSKLSHDIYMPQVDVVITHGGCGTLQKALYYGKPMVIIPLAADQEFLAKRCVDMQVAVTISKDDITTNKIKENVEAIFYEPVFKNNAEIYADKLTKENASSDACSHIERLLNHKEEFLC